jgi:hypothetical protein
VFRAVTMEKHGRPSAARNLAPPLLVLGLASGLALDVASRGRRRSGRRLAAAYVTGLVSAGAYEGIRARQPARAPLIGAALGAMQLSYGCGFWREAVRRLAFGARSHPGG